MRPGCCLEARQSAANSGLEFLEMIAKQLLQQCQNTSMTSGQLSIYVPVRADEQQKTSTLGQKNGQGRPLL
jgi:hypothetical protein